METNPILALLKFGKKKHIEDFVQGRLYTNTLQYFEEMGRKKGTTFGAIHLKGWEG